MSTKRSSDRPPRKAIERLLVRRVAILRDIDVIAARCQRWLFFVFTMIACTITGSAFAQRPTGGAVSPIGVWRGTSICLVHPSPCRDESVVYRITRESATDSLSLDGRKIVNGQEEAMGVLGCRFETVGARLTCPLPRGVWRFTIRGDSLVGELRQPDSTKFREVRTARSP